MYWNGNSAVVHAVIVVNSDSERMMAAHILGVLASDVPQKVCFFEFCIGDIRSMCTENSVGNRKRRTRTICHAWMVKMAEVVGLHRRARPPAFIACLYKGDTKQRKWGNTQLNRSARDEDESQSSSDTDWCHRNRVKKKKISLW